MEAEQVGITQLEMGDHLLTRAIEAFCSRYWIGGRAGPVAGDASTGALRVER